MIGWKEYVIWLALGAWGVMAAWPASFWYEPGQMWVGDYVVGEEMPLRYDGGARHGFTGSYSVVIRKSATNEVVAEDRSSVFQYTPQSQRPTPLTIEWWAPGDIRMKQLTPGEYRMETCWTVHGRFFGVVPSKTTCTDSNIFQVLPRD